MATTWWSYVERVGKGAAQKDIAERSGIDAGALSRWKTGQTPRPSAELAIQFARAYGRPPTEALVAAGFITEDEAAQAIEVHRGLEDISSDDLIKEVRTRMADRPARKKASGNQVKSGLSFRNPSARDSAQHG